MVDISGCRENNIRSDKVFAVEVFDLLLGYIGNIIPNAQCWLSEEVVSEVGEVGSLGDDSCLISDADALPVNALSFCFDLSWVV